MQRGERVHRADIQVLRAVAVIAVVLYHLPRQWNFAGGFVGVDVFFVVSGFVVTESLLRGLAPATSRWAMYRAFLRRRAHRLVPALSAAVAGALLLGLFLGPVRLASTLPAGAFWAETFSSNFYFLGRFDTYWNPEQLSNPLLHTWSLAVEFQIYLLLPLVVLGASTLKAGVPTRFTKRVLVGWMLASLLAFLYLTTTSRRPMGFDPTGLAFYLPVTRLWEVLLGALVSIMATARLLGTTGRVRLATILASVVALIAGTWLSHRAGTLTPAVILCCAGAAGLIAVPSNTAQRAGSSPACRALIWIGDRSYSIYLWHWPLLAAVGWRFPNSAAAVAVALALTLVAASVSFRWLEQYRGARARGRPMRLVTSMATALLLVVAAQLLTRSEWFNRTVEVSVAGVGLTETGLTPDQMAQATANCQHLGSESEIHCDNGAVGGRTVVMIGDSLAYRSFPAVQIAALRHGLNASMMWSGGCGVEAESCPDSVYSFLSKNNVVGVIVAMNFDRAANRVNGAELLNGHEPICPVDLDTKDCAKHRAEVDRFKQLAAVGLDQLLASSPRVLLSLPFPQQAWPPDCKHARFDSTLVRKDNESKCGRTSLLWEAQRQGLYPEAIRALVEHAAGASTWDPLDYLCAQGWCPAVLKSGEWLMTDSIHWSLEASRFIYPPLEAFIAGLSAT